MKLIAALGNIGDKYCFNRHNIGFMTADYMSVNNSFSFKQENKLKCFLAKHNGNLIIKPTTFMNLSGESVRAVLDYYKLNVEDIIIIYDDICLDLGILRFRSSGSDGGHNGIKSIIKHLGTNKFDRLKIGVGPQPPIPSEAFVLQNFSKEQEPLLKQTLKLASDAVEFYLDNGIEKSQNKFN